MTKKIITILGAGNFGTAFAQVMAKNGYIVHIWNWEGDTLPLRQIKKYGENRKYLKGVKLSKYIKPLENFEEALAGTTAVFFAIPSGHVQHTIKFLSRSIPDNAYLVDLSKGIDPHSLELIPHIIAKHVRPSLRKKVVTISGPAIATQLVHGVITIMNIASKNVKAMQAVKRMVENDYVRLVPTTDVIGVEIGGSFKNVYAIAMGMCDSLGYGLNTKAALMTYAMHEIAEVIVAMGGKKKTAYELAGLGDLVGTALADQSRNRRFGEELGKGYDTQTACKRVKQTVEGIDAVRALLALKRQHKLRLPFTEMIASCISGKSNPEVALDTFIKKLK
ncbi:MAG: NAD(P)H-dependent glycerol-3-phosphate dehydrogenase [Candidatus Magasanikbacteria bacterium]|jgi:glycerol-3-phosphate dehydrogenase (NAD(P)+)|nr:NAD(P)H-dependent glycerol-3-phosphate dehydrogenase [Candidatus Magasanikbacteria bacterium]MBT4071589.1 NAD(P)H-dependent glycerol-3-phosphate dehydrogenase [Candidatus Magasanikbacteria bacterium]